MRLLKSKEVLDELVKEAEEMLKDNLSGPDFNNAQHLMLGLLWASNVVLSAKLAELQSQEPAVNMDGGPRP